MLLLKHQITLLYNSFALFHKVRPFNRRTRLTEDDNNASICSWAAVKDNNHIDLVVIVVDIVIVIVKSSCSGCAQTLFSIASPTIFKVMKAENSCKV